MGISRKGLEGVIRSEEQARQILARLSSGPKILAFDTETVGWLEDDTLSPYERAKCVAFSFSDGKDAWCVDGPLLGVFRPLLESRNVTWRGANLKFDAVVCHNHGVALGGIWEDATILSKLLLNGVVFQHGLKQLAKDLLGAEMLHFKDLAGTVGLPKNRKHNFFAIMEANPYVAARYSREDALLSWQVVDRLLLRLSAMRWFGEKSMVEFYREFDAPFTQVLRGMEQRGVLVDGDRLAVVTKQVNEEADKLQDYFESAVHGEFNLDAPDQVAKVLFDKFKLKPLLYTETKRCAMCSKKATKVTAYLCREHGDAYLESVPSTNKLALSMIEEAYGDHDGVVKIRRFRKIHQLRKMFLPHLARPNTDGRIRTTFRQFGAETGRLSSASPNLMNIPRTDNDDPTNSDAMLRGFGLRDLFLPEPGHTFVVADYSQVEVRLGAHLSGDKNMLAAFTEHGRDIHSEAAVALFGLTCPPKQVKTLHPELRSAAKAFVFGVFYGMGYKRASRAFRCSHAQAKTYIDAFFEQFPGIKQMRSAVERQVLRDGYMRTLLGRYRYFRVLGRAGKSAAAAAAIQDDEDLRGQYAAELREAMNLGEQGGAMDVIQTAMLVIDGHAVPWHPLGQDQRLVNLGLRQTLQIHDELVCQVPVESAAAAKDLIELFMKDPVPNLRVPLIAEAGVGMTWSSAKK